MTLGVKNAIRVNERMETSADSIYAAGDCAVTYHLVSGQEVYIPMGTAANKQGKIAGENAGGGNARSAGVLGTGIARVMDMDLAYSPPFSPVWDPVLIALNQFA